MRGKFIRTLVLVVASMASGKPVAATQDAPPSSPQASSEAAAPAAASLAENAVVKVFSTVTYPDYYKPWSRQAPSERIGSGVIIEGRRILTCAHLVLYASQVQVQANQSAAKVPATVAGIAEDVDLALLRLEDETNFASRPPLPRVDSLPTLKDTVTTYGYPIGGNSLSVTKGIVSRIEFTTSAPFSAGHLQMHAPDLDVEAIPMISWPAKRVFSTRL